MKIIKHTYDGGFQFLSKYIVLDSFGSNGFWIRFYFSPFNTAGFRFKNLKKDGLSFSERYGYKKKFIVFNWCITIMGRIKQ